MKRLSLAFAVLCLVGGAVVYSASVAPSLDFLFPKEGDRNPVTHLRLNNDPSNFQFAIVSDRTGGHRARVFSRAVGQINLLQPEFVLCVGDLIEGYTNNADTAAKEWREFQGYVSQLEMPFFYVVGNHDITNPMQGKLWKEKFGRSYYEFVYRDVLFLMLNSEDPPGIGGAISKEQRAFIKKTLDANPTSRWTMIHLHRPLWTNTIVTTTGWLEVEKLLGDRPYTVFVGHEHNYQKFVRNGRNYYQLATTGGSSKVRGAEYGEFDHIVWVTMKKDGPVFANILLDGVLPENLKVVETAEEGFPELGRLATHPVKGKVLFDGQPVAQAFVVLESADRKARKVRADAFSQADGSFRLSTYTANDGVPAGDYAVTVVLRKPFYTELGKPGVDLLPRRYAQPTTSPLRASIKAGDNNLVLELQR